MTATGAALAIGLGACREVIQTAEAFRPCDFADCGRSLRAKRLLIGGSVVSARDPVAKIRVVLREQPQVLFDGVRRDGSVACDLAGQAIEAVCLIGR